MPVTFDGDNLRIILDTSTTVDVRSELYSDWKDWFKTGGNSKYPVAFDTTGGDPISATQDVAPYFFLRNDLGWRIKAPESNVEISLNGNLFPRSVNLPALIMPDGNFTVLLRQVVSPQALEVNGGGGLSPEQDAKLTNNNDILNADEHRDATNNKFFKRHKDTKAVLVEKDYVGPNIEEDITLTEPSS